MDRLSAVMKRIKTNDSLDARFKTLELITEIGENCRAIAELNHKGNRK